MIYGKECMKDHRAVGPVEKARDNPGDEVALIYPIMNHAIKSKNSGFWSYSRQE